MNAPTGNPALAASAGSASLSPEMRRCLERINEASGTITRYPGGFWYPKEGMASFGTTTVEALVKRGALEYCEWKESHGRQFPIKARLTPNAPAPLTTNTEDNHET